MLPSRRASQVCDALGSQRARKGVVIHSVKATVIASAVLRVAPLVLLRLPWLFPVPYWLWSHATVVGPPHEALGTMTPGFTHPHLGCC